MREPNVERDGGDGLGGYLRMSQPDVNGIHVQQDELEDELGVTEFYVDDGVRADLHWTKRPALRRLLFDVMEGRLRGLAVTRLDRLARDVDGQEEILALVWGCDGRVVSVREGDVLPDGPGSDARRMARRQRAFLSEQELMMIRERRRKGRARVSARGGYNGGRQLYRKYGYELVEYFHRAKQQVKRDWEPVEHEIVIVREIHDRCPGEVSYEAMATELNARGVPTVGGGPWRKWTIRKIALRVEPLAYQEKRVARLPVPEVARQHRKTA